MLKIALPFSAVISLMSSFVFGQYAPPAGQVGSTAIHKDSNIIVGWADRVEAFNPGPQDISNVGSPAASYGSANEALGYAEGNSADVVSLGDGGSITLGFPFPLMNGPGPDFAVFENSFTDDFLEFAHVEVSSDGVNFIRIPSHSLVQTSTQTGGFGNTNTTEIHNLAGKYRQGFGTPFDLEDLADSSGIDLDSVLFVRIVDVVGSIDPEYGTYDNYGNLINDPFPTGFESGGFDLDAVGMINVNGVFQVSVPEDELKISVYPNPTQHQITIKFEQAKMLDLTITDVSGKTVYSISINESITLELRNLGLDDGIYFIQLSDGNYRRIEKIILTR